MVKDAIFCSVWDGGSIAIESACKVNMDTKEVFDIEKKDVDNLDIDVLDEEYVMIDGEEYSVSCAEAGEERDTEYFYL